MKRIKILSILMVLTLLIGIVGNTSESTAALETKELESLKVPMSMVEKLDITYSEYIYSIEKMQAAATPTSSFYIKWTGASSSENAQVVQQKNYDGNKLGIQVVVKGTPTWDLACVITVTPLNCKLKSGAKNVQIPVYSANFGYTFLNYITPEKSYKGKTVKFSVSINGTPGGVFEAKGSIGAV